MLEFKLNYYFEKYKDCDILSSTKFKSKFEKENGKFELINELIVMIQKYQYKTYGNLIGAGKSTYRFVKKGTFNSRELMRLRRRFGTKEERQNRRRLLDV